MMIRSSGFYHDDNTPGRQARDTAALAILLVIVSVLGAAIVVLARPDLVCRLFLVALPHLPCPAG
jgi:hypothetical protein